jgi:hypothetical protein
MSSPYQRAIDAGYTPEEIHEHLSKSDPKYKKALESGYSPEEIHSFFSQKKEPEKPSFETDEDLEREIERNQAQFTSRMIERLLGTPGNIYQMLPEALHKVNPLHFLHKHLPTEKQLRGFSEKASLGYTKPKTEFEEQVGDVGADVASFAMGSPGKTLLGGLSKVIGIPIAGELAKEGIEQFGGSKSAQQYGKLGTMLLLDLWGLRRGIGEGGAYKYGIKLLDEAEKSIPKGAIADVKVFENKLNSLDKSLRGGVTGAHTSEALRAIDEIKGHIKNGQMEAWRFPRIRKDINKLIDNMKGFSLQGPPAKIKKAAVENLNQVKNALIQAGNRWGRGKAPEFFKNWREGNEALSVFHRSNDLGKFFANKTKISNPVLKHLLGAGIYHHPGKLLGAAALKKTAEKSVEFPTVMVTRFFKSKVLRGLYQKVIREALKGESGAAASTIKKIEYEMDKEGIE